MIDRVEIESLLNVTQFNGSTSHWTEVRHQNCRDYDVPGVVVFRGYVWMFCTFLAVYFSLLKKVFFAGGLVRKMCITGTGSFYMEGRRQTSMASSTLIAPASEGTEFHYYSPSIINPTLLPLVKNIVNFMGDEALQHQQSSGEILLSLLRVALKNAGSPITTAGICISNIITYNFANSPHKDCDKMQQECSEAVKDLIRTSRLQKLTRWLSSFHQLFGEKERLPMPTTCCWSLMKESDDWDHLQHFVLLDMHIAFDISSNVMVKIGQKGNLGQAGATFYGPLFKHCTSASLWISKDGSRVTVLPPTNDCFNAAWGKSGGPRAASNAKKTADSRRRRENIARDSRRKKRDKR